jgi:hypothetical protein
VPEHPGLLDHVAHPLPGPLVAEVGADDEQLRVVLGRIR